MGKYSKDEKSDNQIVIGAILPLGMIVFKLRRKIRSSAMSDKQTVEALVKPISIEAINVGK